MRIAHCGKAWPSKPGAGNVDTISHFGTTGGDGVNRLLLALVALLAAAVLVPGIDQGDAVVLGAALSVLAVAVLAASTLAVATPVPVSAGVATRRIREQARRGAYRRVSSPDTPGKPRPRAPGQD